MCLSVSHSEYTWIYIQTYILISSYLFKTVIQFNFIELFMLVYVLLILFLLGHILSTDDLPSSRYQDTMMVFYNIFVDSNNAI